MTSVEASGRSRSSTSICSSAQRTVAASGVPPGTWITGGSRVEQQLLGPLTEVEPATAEDRVPRWSPAGPRRRWPPRRTDRPGSAAVQTTGQSEAEWPGVSETVTLRQFDRFRHAVHGEQEQLPRRTAVNLTADGGRNDNAHSPPATSPVDMWPVVPHER